MIKRELMKAAAAGLCLATTRLAASASPARAKERVVTVTLPGGNENPVVGVD